MDTRDVLTGKFLLATPKMPDRRFAENVIFICSHSEDEGAMGLVVNQPYGQIFFSDLLGKTDGAVADKKMTDIYIGGPVEPEAGFILYERFDYTVEGQMVVTETIAVSREKKTLEDLVQGKGPANYLFTLGYVGWGVGQLEAELVRDGWLVLPASNEVIFHMDNAKKWSAAASAYGIDIAVFEDEAGSA